MLEMSSSDLDQATLDAALSQTHPACVEDAGGRASARTHAGPTSAFNTLDEPLNGRSLITVSWPLGRHDQTMDAPLHPSGGPETIEEPLGAATRAREGDPPRPAAHDTLPPVAERADEDVTGSPSEAVVA